MKSIELCFEILGCDQGATFEQVKRAYKDLVRVWHPDRFAHDPRLQQKAEEKLKEIDEAYEQLHSFFSDLHNSRSSKSNPASGPSKSDDVEPEPPPEQAATVISWLWEWRMGAVIAVLIV